MSEDFSDFDTLIGPNENAKDRMHGWLQGGLENATDDDLRTHLDMIFAPAVPESMLTVQEKRRKSEQGGDVVDSLTAQFRETLNQKQQLEANIIENHSLHKRLEAKELEMTTLKSELMNSKKDCSDLRLQIAIMQEQLQARTKNEERLQSEADAARGNLAGEKRWFAASYSRSHALCRNGHQIFLECL